MPELDPGLSLLSSCKTSGQCPQVHSWTSSDFLGSGHSPEPLSQCLRCRAGQTSANLCVCECSDVSDSVAPWTVAHQAPLSLGFSRQDYWSGLPFPPPGGLPDPGIGPTSLVSPALASGFFTTLLPGIHNISQGSMTNQSIFPAEPQISSIAGFQVTLTNRASLAHQGTLMGRGTLTSCISPCVLEAFF